VVALLSRKLEKNPRDQSDHRECVDCFDRRDKEFREWPATGLTAEKKCFPFGIVLTASEDVFQVSQALMLTVKMDAESGRIHASVPLPQLLSSKVRSRSAREA
jgi:hypothetical protein